MGCENYKQFLIYVIVCYCVLVVKSYPRVYASKIRKYRNTLLDQLEPIELDTQKYYSSIIVDKHIRGNYFILLVIIRLLLATKEGKHGQHFPTRSGNIKKTPAVTCMTRK